MTSPLISNIQRFSVDDGPGIRTTVFLKGCNLRCRWCHNPECISFPPSLQLIESSCTSCGRCVERCPDGVHEITPEGQHRLHRERCTGCGACAYACLNTALTIIGQPFTPDELVSKLERDKKYFETSKGGVTISGGDPMLFPVYTAQVLALLKKKGIHTAVDTAGCVPWANFEQVLPNADLFLYDVKAASRALHQALTGVDNTLILDNLHRLSAAGARIFVRVPVIPGCNDSADELSAIASLLAALPTPPELTQLLPYHSYGAGKYATLGLKEPLGVLKPPSQAFMENILLKFLQKDLTAVIS
jgi:glycyl-radical enzyme activating protein